MSDKNPYLQETEVPLPTQKYTLRIRGDDQQEHAIEVNPDALPDGHVGRPGSILNLALAHGLEIDHACGGVCACATCHVIVRQGLDTCNDPSDDEEDQLDEAPGVTPKSRLACQCVPNGTQDVVVEVPAWNRNLAREAPH